MIEVDDPPEVAGKERADDTVPREAHDDGADDRDPEQLSRRGRITMAVLSLVTVALVVLAVVFWQQVSTNARQDQDRQAVLNLARQQAVTLTTVNPKNVKEQMRLLLAHSTGEFRRQFDAASPTFAKVVNDGEVSSKGTVAEAGVVSLSDDRSSVLVALNSTVRNSETDEDEPRNYRLRVDLEKEADQWLVSNMRFVP